MTKFLFICLRDTIVTFLCASEFGSSFCDRLNIFHKLEDFDLLYFNTRVDDGICNMNV